MRLRTRSVLAALPLVLTLALTACGSDDDGGGVATVDGGKTNGGGADAAASLNPDEMRVKFAECMRKNGVDIPDPEPGKPQMLKFDKNSGVDRATVDKAMKACQQYNSMANAAPGSDPQAEERGRKFAECMRKNGVEKFPDPKPGQRGVQIGPEVGDDPDFQNAQKQCQEILAGGSGAGAKP
ncbi:hypothetical protein [Actinomadura alba]|uniref:Lipoprotein n=1 Tax=Actinomadura alba TaxID=406431 RepID=A0ABR7LPI5_9ACTN|nr:hypothetical protein [Actinomadura alba]MBC6466484.1 hypothetical protein [Actinomadura alba]